MRKATRAQWIKCAIAIILYLIFLVWVKSWWGLTFHLRHLHYQESPLVLLEKIEKPDRTQCYELGRCHRFCFGSRILCEYIYIPELSDPFFLFGEIFVSG